MKQGSKTKAIYRLAEGVWIGWAASALIALLSVSRGNNNALSLSAVFSMLYATMGVYVLMEGRVGFEGAVEGKHALPAWPACFVYASAPLGTALAVTAGIISWIVGKTGRKSPDFISASFNVAMTIATLWGVLRAQNFPKAPVKKKVKPGRLLKARDFYIALVLLFICLACLAALIATRTRVEETRDLREIAFNTGAVTFLAYLVLLFRPAAFHLAKSPQEVMDDGDRPALWLRVLLIYTAQTGLICVVVNGFILLAAGAAKGNLLELVQALCATATMEALFISACIVATRCVRGDPLPRPKPATIASPARNAPQPAGVKPKPPAVVPAGKRRRLLYDRAKELERESVSNETLAPAPEDSPSIAEQTPETIAKCASAPAAGSPASAPLTPAERMQRQALETELVSILRLYHDNLERQERERLSARNAASSRAHAAAAGVKATAPSETKRNDAARDRADGQKRLRALRALHLEKESVIAAQARSKGTSQEDLERLLERAAALLEPCGAELGTVRGQRALFGDLKTLLPGMEALDADETLSMTERKGGTSLPEAVGRLLEQVCDVLIRTVPDEAISRWDMLSPAALTRGWRVLKVYGEISTAGAMFNAVAARLTSYMRTRSDCETWLAVYAGEGGQ